MTDIHLVVTGRNTLPFLDRNISSIRENLSRMSAPHTARCTWIDDASDDGTQDAITWTHPTPGVRRILNTKRRGGMRNLERAIGATDPGEVVVILDGDDWFDTPVALRRIANEFADPGCWVTYGSMMTVADDGSPGFGMGNEPYHPQVLEDSSFRRVGWRCTHPRAFRAWLFHALTREELRTPDGTPWEGAKDQAFMLPILEMAGMHVRHIPEILYCYNVANPASYHHTDVDKQTRACLALRSRAPRKALEMARHE